MKYLIENSAHYIDKPCKGAEQNGVLVKEMKLVENIKEDWYNEGINHSERNGVATRYIEKDFWTIELESFEQLNNFVKEHEEVIIKYDDFLEAIRITLHDKKYY